MSRIRAGFIGFVSLMLAAPLAFAGSAVEVPVIDMRDATPQQAREKPADDQHAGRGQRNGQVGRETFERVAEHRDQLFSPSLQLFHALSAPAGTRAQSYLTPRNSGRRKSQTRPAVAAEGTIASLGSKERAAR